MPEGSDETYILGDAREAVYERAGEHGEPEDNFDTIARFWSAYLDMAVHEQDVVNMMVLLKVARNADGVYTGENYEDIAGYAENGARLEEGTATIRHSGRSYRFECPECEAQVSPVDETCVGCGTTLSAVSVEVPSDG